jgi:hypothetical protein
MLALGLLPWLDRRRRWPWLALLAIGLATRRRQRDGCHGRSAALHGHDRRATDDPELNDWWTSPYYTLLKRFWLAGKTT